MPANENKRRCAYPGCRSWARREAYAPYCASHVHLAHQAGLAPRDGAFLTPGRPSSRRDPGPAPLAQAAVEDDNAAAESQAREPFFRSLLQTLDRGITSGPDPRPLDTTQRRNVREAAFWALFAIIKLYAAHYNLPDHTAFAADTSVCILQEMGVVAR